MMRKRIAVSFAVLAAILVALSIAYFAFRTTLPERLEREVAPLLPAGTPRSTVEAWAKQQPAHAGTFWKYDGGIGGTNIIRVAGLDPNKVGYTIRVDYDESRWPDKLQVRLFFFFDSEDWLIKHWITESFVSP